MGRLMARHWRPTRHAHHGLVMRKNRPSTSAFVFGLAEFGMNRYRMIITYVTIVPSQQISWILVIYAENLLYLCVARFLIGLSGAACFMVLPLLVTEIADDKIRGVLASALTLTMNLGILIGFIFGYLFEYSLVPKMMLAIPLLFLVTFYFFPESPWYLMKRNKINVSASVGIFEVPLMIVPPPWLAGSRESIVLLSQHRPEL